MSLFSYIRNEVTRSYLLEHDQERYTSKREKMYTFMRIPRELEKFMSYGFFHCLDSFLFIYTFLPLRVSLALVTGLLRTPLIYLGYAKAYHGRNLFPAETIDILKVFIILVCCYAMSYVDTSMLYHMIKSQSVIKLYLMYNMIEVADRLFSAFGQDTIDALFWTATEPRGKKREHIGVVPHLLLALGYVFLHALLVLLQATTLNVAINSSNKALLTIMMSNNFVELKGSVFKKFDKNNLFQVSCSDVRERFHLFALLFVVVLQTMKEYGWREESFWSLAPDCLTVLGAEIIVDWLKHAFITRFNEVSAEVYKDYTISLAYDLAQTKEKQAFSDHSDIVSRRMGFIPLPLGVVMLRVVYTSMKSTNPGAIAVALLAYICLFTFRVLGSIVILGKACDLIEDHKQKQQQKKKQSVEESNKDHQAGRREAKDSNAARNEACGTPQLLGHRKHVEVLPAGQRDQTATAAPQTPTADDDDCSELFQLPDRSSERLFLFQNSCDDKADVLLTNMNVALLESPDSEHGRDTTPAPEEAFSEGDLSDRDTHRQAAGQSQCNTQGVEANSINSALHMIGAELQVRSSAVRDEIVRHEADKADSVGGRKVCETLFPMDAGLSPASKAKSLSSPDLIRSEANYEEWDSDAEEIEERLTFSSEGVASLESIRKRGVVQRP